MLFQNGRPVANPTDCCCIVPCEHCEDATPGYFELVPSGISLCSGCYEDPATGYYTKWDVPPPALPASMLLKQAGRVDWWGQDGDPCHYQYRKPLDLDPSAHIQTYTDSGCTVQEPGFEGWDIFALHAELTVTATGMHLDIWYGAYGWDDVWGSRTYAFVGSKATSTPCGGTTVINADRTICAGDYDSAPNNNDWLTGRAGGVVTVEPK